MWLAALLALAACAPAPRTGAPSPPPARPIPSELAPAPAPHVADAAPSKAPPRAESVPAAPPKASLKESPKETPKEAPKAATKPAPPKAPVATAPKSAPPAKSDTPAQPARVPTLDLKSLEQRLRDTGAIGLMTKLSLKNQVDDLLDKFRDYHRGALKVPLAELRRPYELLLMKVLTLLQDGDPALAQSINASREAIWSVLTDREKFAQYT